MIFSFVLKGTGVTVFKLEESCKSCSFIPLFVSLEDPPTKPELRRENSHFLSMTNKTLIYFLHLSLPPFPPSLPSYVCWNRSSKQKKCDYFTELSIKMPSKDAALLLMCTKIMFSSLVSFFSDRIKERSDFQREDLQPPRPPMTSEPKTANRTFLVGFSFSGVRLRRLRSPQTKQYRLYRVSVSFKNLPQQAWSSTKDWQINCSSVKPGLYKNNWLTFIQTCHYCTCFSEWWV